MFDVDGLEEVSHRFITFLRHLRRFNLENHSLHLQTNSEHCNRFFSF
jgi:hypothetical protein